MFELGQIVATPAALAILEENGLEYAALLYRHASLESADNVLMLRGAPLVLRIAPALGGNVAVPCRNDFVLYFLAHSST